MAEASPPIADPNARSELGRIPVPGGNPAGEPPNDLPEFETLREEATRDPVQGPPSWESVGKLGEQLLRDKTKDFVVASYTGVAFAHTDGADGLHDALRILDDMLRTWWEQASPPIPKRMRARASAVQWFAEKVGGLLERTEFKPGDAEKLEASLEAAQSLADALAEKFPPDTEVGVGPILSALRDSSSRLAADAAAQRPAPAAAAAPAASRPAGPVGQAPAAASAPGEIKNRNDAVRVVREVAGFLREQDPAGPEALALPRLMSWCQVVQPPPAEGGKTMLPPPPARASIEAALAGPPAALLAAVELAFTGAPLWLDLQRHAVSALDQLGPAQRPARDLVVALLRDLLSRVPGLSQLHFNDGSELADASTRQWLAEEVLSGAEAEAAAPSAATQSAVDPAALASLRREAKALLKKGQIAEVQARLAELFLADPSPRARFAERLELATLCFEAGRERVALGMLDGLEREMLDHELDRWDPPLASRVLQALYRAHLKVLGKNLPPEQAARREEVFGRLCRIDPALAIAVD